MKISGLNLFRLKKFLVPTILSTVTLFLLASSDIHNPVKWLTNDFYIEAYQATSKGLGQSNDKIAIVNISDFPPEVIKDQIHILSQYDPAVIGLDYFLPDSLNSGGQVVQFEDLVLPMAIDQNDSAQYSLNCFSTNAHYGLTSIYSPSYFEPFLKSRGTEYPLLPTRIIQLYDSILFRKLLQREKEREIINYLGNTSSFLYLGDLASIQATDALKSIKNKIVLVGYTGIYSPYPSEADNYDAHLTPQGKMFGVVLLANIVHTLMDNQIDSLPPLHTALIIASLIGLAVSVVHFFFLKVRYAYWLIKLFQIFLLVALFSCAAFMIHNFNRSIDYEIIAFSILITPEITYWWYKYSS